MTVAATIDLESTGRAFADVAGGAQIGSNPDGTTCWDVIVIGAGPAGSLAARQMAINGVRVLLVDRAAFPRWKVCGACVNQTALSVLDRVGMSDVVAGLDSIPIGEFQLHAGKRTTSLKLPGGIAVSRTDFDAALVTAAIESGAEFLPETSASLDQLIDGARQVLLRQPAGVATAAARVVIVADGLGGNSLKRSPPFQSQPSRDSRIGVGGVAYDRDGAYRPGTIYMAVGKHGYVGLVRLHDGSLNIAAALDRDVAKHGNDIGTAIETILRETGHTDSLSSSLPMDLNWQGTVSLTRKSTPVAADRVFVLGDAAGYVEPFTGEGIAWALSSAALVAPIVERAVLSWHPDPSRQWSEIHHRAIGRRQRVCRLLARVLRHPWFVGTSVRALSCMPALANPVIRRLNSQPPAQRVSAESSPRTN